MKRVDVAIIGGGVMGCATAWQLARAGRSVVLFERFEIGHPYGSSHGGARIFRESYRDPQYVAMMREAIPLWRALEEEAGEQLLAVTGAVNIGDLSYLKPAMFAAGSAFELLDRDEAQDRFAGVDPGQSEALFDPTAGVVFAERAWRAFAARAEAHGAEIREGVVAHPREEGSVVRVDDVEAGVAVITAGPWVKDLVPDVPVRPTRETVAHYDIGELASVPVLIDWAFPMTYGLPTPDGLFKAGKHIAGVPVHPDEPGSADDASLRQVDDWIARHLPGRASVRVRAETCMYTNTADESFILERRGNIVIGSPCSGHGFKFAPLIGARLAALASADR